MYAIVDIETTGSYASANGITEICIHVYDGADTLFVFESLVNPMQPIPRYIQAMTGISDEMVRNAPTFAEIAPQVYEALNGKVFIAHNVNFDHSFVKAGLQACGFDLQVKKLCTVRLSRKILPGLPSYSLGNLCHSLGITIANRHRAGGDTAATVEVFRILQTHDQDDFITKSLVKSSKEQCLPPNVPKSDFDKLPYTPGVYYFHDQKGKVVYVGKAKNIRYRVNSHFSGHSESRQRQNFLKHIHSISFTTCGTELMAHILESTEIKKLWPAFNLSQKRPEQVYGIFDFTDQRGYLRLAIEKVKQGIRPIHSFHYITDAHQFMRKLIRDYELCPRLCFLQKQEEACDGTVAGGCHGACEGLETPAEYNQRVQRAIDALGEAEPSFAIVEQGLGSADLSCILMWKGKFYGMGYLDAQTPISDHEALRDQLTPYKENLYIRNLVNGYASKFPSRVKWLGQGAASPVH